MWKSVPQVRQAHISQDFFDRLICLIHLSPWRKMPRFFEVFQQLAKHEPPLQCESFEVHGCLGLQVDQAGNESTFLERNLHTSKYIGFCLCQKRF